LILLRPDFLDPPLETYDLVIFLLEVLLEVLYNAFQPLHRAIQNPDPFIGSGIDLHLRSLNNGPDRPAFHLREHLFQRLPPHYPGLHFIQVISRRDPSDKVLELVPITPECFHCRSKGIAFMIILRGEGSSQLMLCLHAHILAGGICDSIKCSPDLLDRKWHLVDIRCNDKGFSDTIYCLDHIRHGHLART